LSLLCSRLPCHSSRSLQSCFQSVLGLDQSPSVVLFSCLLSPPCPQPFLSHSLSHPLSLVADTVLCLWCKEMRHCRRWFPRGSSRREPSNRHPPPRSCGEMHSQPACTAVDAAVDGDGDPRRRSARLVASLAKELESVKKSAFNEDQLPAQRRRQWRPAAVASARRGRS